MSDRTKKTLKVLSVIFAIVFYLALTAFLGRPLLATAEDPEAFRDWVQERGVLSRIVFVGMVFLQVVVALIPGEPLEICAGVAFGALEGTLLCLAGIFLGSLCVFFLVRRFGVRLLEIFFPIEKIRSLGFLQNSKKFDILLFGVMMIPGTPKDLIGYFIPLTDIRIGHLMFLCTFARIPSVVTSTFSGSALGEGEYLSAVILFAVTGVLSILGAILFDRLLKKREKRKKMRE